MYVLRPRSGSVVAEVPEGRREIVVDGVKFRKAMKTLSARWDLFASKSRDMLVFLLLHELGHIDAGHYGQFLPNASQASLNLADDPEKEREFDADRFVVSVIKPHWELARVGEADFAALELALTLAELSFVVAEHTALDCFGCRVIGSPEVFWDHSRSHPSFEYRLLRLNHAIAPSDASRQLLRDFEEGRQTSRAPSVLYRAHE